jgi:DUF1009 family protein
VLAVPRGKVLLVEGEAVRRMADEAGIAVIGIDEVTGALD